MKPSAYLFVSMLLVGALAGPPAQSQEVKVGDLVISQPWSRAAPSGSELASSYLTIENKGTAADRLVGASSDVAEKIEIQQISMAGGATSSDTVDKGLGISAGDKVVLAPGGYKLALLKLKSAMKKGTKVSMTLEFEKAGKVTVPFEVLGASAKGPAPPKADGKMKK
ncbi:copper chaperone PCu(A)C [Bradyrhizobium sp.]|uniref:copper chaperone PCu(A)C n=1 Tax=Bradyrhizobium sp. TaxID=376 RepID=UPI0025C356D5|nr:copper chaperone PCu(A)C [Bradyrhizobium sp.]